LLRELDPDELEEVRDREAAGRARATILNRIDQLLGQEQVFADEFPISRPIPQPAHPRLPGPIGAPPVAAAEPGLPRRPEPERPAPTRPEPKWSEPERPEAGFPIAGSPGLRVSPFLPPYSA